MLKELMNHNFLGVKFFRDETGKIYVSDELVSGGFHAGKLVKEIAQVAGGNGGGKAGMAQAGAKDESKLEEAFELAKTLVANN